MSCEIKYKCDHCGDDVSPYIGKQWRASMLTVGPSMDDIHACSKEHLGFAVANAFGVPIDANAAAIALTRNVLHSSNEAKASRIAELEAHAATLTGLANQYKADRDSLEETCRMYSARVIELEKQRDEFLSRPDAVEVLRLLRSKGGALDFDGETGMQMLAMIEDAIASITDTTKPTKPARAEGDHVHEVGSCTHCDTNASEKKATLVVCEFCLGRGRIIDLFLKTEKPCEACNGFGKVIQ